MKALPLLGVFFFDKFIMLDHKIIKIIKKIKKYDPWWGKNFRTNIKTIKNFIRLKNREKPVCIPKYAFQIC